MKETTVETAAIQRTTGVEEEEARRDEDEEAAPAAWHLDFHWLTDQLAVGGSFPVEGIAGLAEDYEFRAVVDLRQERSDDPEQLRAAGIDFLHLPTPDLYPATHEHFEKGVAFVRERLDRGEKVLIHCEHGIGRSALLSLCVLVDGGWKPLDALSHAKDRRERISPSQLQYEGWCGWLRSRGIEPPDYHSFGCIAYRHLANG